MYTLIHGITIEIQTSIFKYFNHRKKKKKEANKFLFFSLDKQLLFSKHVSLMKRSLDNCFLGNIYFKF